MLYVVGAGLYCAIIALKIPGIISYSNYTLILYLVIITSILL